MNNTLESEDVLVNIGLITASIYIWMRDAAARGKV